MQTVTEYKQRNEQVTNILKVLSYGYFSGPIQSDFTGGTVSTPAINFGDTTTGIFRPALNEIDFTNAGVLTMRLSSGNRVEIGPTAPSIGSNLPLLTLNKSVNGDAAAGDLEIFNAGTGNTRVYIESEGTTATHSRAIIFGINGTGVSGNWWSGGPVIANTIFIQEDQNASYNVSTPTFVIELECRDSYWHTSNANQNIYFVAGTTNKALLSDGVWQTADGAVGTPAHGFLSDPDNGMYRVGTNSWAFSAAGAKIWQTTAAGEITRPLQTSFLAINTTTQTDVTGDGTLYTLVFSTEVYDQNADFDGTSTFTAPVTGRYHFDLTVLISGYIPGTHTDIALQLVTTARTYVTYLNKGATNMADFSMSLSTDADMTAADTAIPKLIINGGTKVIDILTSGATVYNRFSGSLIN